MTDGLRSLRDPPFGSLAGAPGAKSNPCLIRKRVRRAVLHGITGGGRKTHWGAARPGGRASHPARLCPGRPFPVFTIPSYSLYSGFTGPVYTSAQ